MEHWIKPSMGELKVNYGAALFSREKSHDLGWIARNHAGLCFAAAAVKLQGDVDPIVAEAMSMKEALLKSFVLQRSLWSQTLFCWLMLLIAKAKFFLLLVLLFRIFVKRSENQAANWLARSSDSCPDRISSTGSVPSGLEAILLADLL
ncbi:hypothetical protein CsatB_014861 [Cannabis sativa]